MKEDFVNIELAIKLKELGFNIPFFSYYRTDDKKLYHLVRSQPLIYDKDIIDNEVVIAPTIAQVLKWLRKEHKLHICIDLDSNKYWFYSIEGITGNTNITDTNDYFSYEDTALAGIEYTLDKIL